MPSVGVPQWIADGMVASVEMNLLLRIFFNKLLHQNLTQNHCVLLLCFQMKHCTITRLQGSPNPSSVRLLGRVQRCALSKRNKHMYRYTYLYCVFVDIYIYYTYIYFFGGEESIFFFLTDLLHDSNDTNDWTAIDLCWLMFQYFWIALVVFWWNVDRRKRLLLTCRITTSSRPNCGEYLQLGLIKISGLGW